MKNTPFQKLRPTLKDIPCFFVFFIYFIIFMNTSCSTATRTEDVSIAPVTIRLFVAHAFASGTQYERYFYERDALWRECGKVRGKAQQKKRNRRLLGDDVFPYDPNFVIEERRVERLKRKNISRIIDALYDLQTYVRNHSDTKELPPPDSIFSLHGKGVFILVANIQGNEMHILTSVDAVSDTNSQYTLLLRKVFRTIRHYGPIMCNEKTFYGIGRY